VDGSVVFRVDPPFNEDGSDGRPGYESIDIPKYGWGNPFVAYVFGAIVSMPNLCDKKLGMRVFLMHAPSSLYPP
jgi:hypothetical protein